MNTTSIMSTERENLNKSMSNPISSSDESMDRVYLNVTKIVEILDNSIVNDVIKNEFGKEYPTLRMLVEERLLLN